MNHKCTNEDITTGKIINTLKRTQMKVTGNR